MVPGREMTIQNILTGKRMTVIERMLTTQVNPKEILFTRAVVVDDIGMLVGTGRTLMPHSIKPTLIEMRKGIRGDRLFVTDEDLGDWDMDLRRLYLDIDRGFQTQPKLQNSDGEALEPHKLVYTIDDSEKVFKKLAVLCTVESEKSLRSQSQTDEKQRVLKADFPWTKKGNRQIPEWDNTILGEFQITQKRLTINVNSADRAKKIKQEIKKRLGKLAGFQMDVIEDMNGMLEEMPENSKAFEKVGSKHDALVKVPEIRHELGKTVLDHWDRWMNIPLPALGNETPRNAVKNNDGKEAVEALLYDAVTLSPDPLMLEMNKKGVGNVCRDLGLEFPK